MRGWEKDQASRRRAAFDRGAYDALHEVMDMAEGRDGIKLGRLPKGRR